MALVGAVLFAGLGFALLQPNHAGPLKLPIMIFCLAACVILTTLSLVLLRISRNRVAINPDGIWFLARNGRSTFLAWPEVASVKAAEGMQRLILKDATGARIIRVEYQLKNFGALREFILTHTHESVFRDPSDQRIFRTWLGTKIFYAVCSMFFFATSAFAHLGQHAAEASYFLAAMGLFPLLAIPFDPSGINVEDKGLAIIYPLWSRYIAFDSISKISLQDMPTRGNVWVAVVIALRSGKNIRLYRFREGSIAVNGALQSAWERGKASPI